MFHRDVTMFGQRTPMEAFADTEEVCVCGCVFLTVWDPPVSAAIAGPQLDTSWFETDAAAAGRRAAHRLRVK